MTELSATLQNYRETPDELVQAARTGPRALEAELMRCLTPECHHRRGTCDHGFPAWFIRQSGARLLAAIMRRFTHI